MKKFLIAVFTALALAAWVVPSMALDTVFDGQFRVRAIYVNNAVPISITAAGLQPSRDQSSWIDQRYRLGVKTSEGSITAYVQLQIGDRGANAANGSNKVWGADNGSIGGTGQNAGFDAIAVRQAWIEFPTGPIRVKLGRTYVAHGFLGNGLFDNIVDRAAFTYKMDDNTVISFIHAKPNDSRPTGTGLASTTDTTQNDGDRNVYNLGFTHKMGDMGDAAARIYYVRDGRNGYNATGGTSLGGQFNGTWLAAQTNLKLNPVNVYISGSYLTGTTRDNTAASTKRDIDAYAAHVDVNANVGPAKVGLISGYGSGDKNTGDNKLKTFFAPGPASYLHTALFFSSSQPQNNNGLGSVGDDTNGGVRLNQQNGNRQTLSNIQWAGLYGDFKTTDDLTLSAIVAKFKKAAALSGESKDIGSELDLAANYQLQKGLAIVGTAARFWPGASFSNQTGSTVGIANETITLLFARLQWDF